jgi:iron complex transport system permease protein
MKTLAAGPPGLANGRPAASADATADTPVEDRSGITARSRVGVPRVGIARRRRFVATLLAFTALTIVVCVLAPLVGSTPVSLTRAFDRRIPFAQNVDAQIFFVARLPRVLAGAIVGGMLAASGVVLQALLRNPLADPFTLGVSAGASVGAMIAIVFGAALALGPIAPVPVASLAGALLAALVVYRRATAARCRRRCCCWRASR